MAENNYKNIFLPQVLEYVAEVEKKAKNRPNAASIMAATKMQANAFSKFVSAEASKNEKFNEALAYEWKSVERLYDYINAKAFSFYAGGSAPAIVPDNAVYSWIIEYYMLDDKAEWEEQKAREAKEKAEREAKAAEAKAKAEEAKKKEAAKKKAKAEKEAAEKEATEKEASAEETEGTVTAQEEPDAEEPTAEAAEQEKEATDDWEDLSLDDFFK